MAQIVSQTIAITFSKLVKTGEEASSIVADDIAQALEQVAQELAGAGVVVEVEQV